MSDTSIKFKKLDLDNWYHHFKLPDDIIVYLWKQIEIAKKENIDVRKELAGNISSSLNLKDPENIIINKIFAGLFNSPYRPHFMDIIYHSFRRTVSCYVQLSASPSLDKLWVNFQKKYEFNPIHDHAGLFSFVIWMKIPYEYENEKELPFIKGTSGSNVVGNFIFLPSAQLQDVIKMGKDMEGYCVFFPSHLRHMVYPFYTSDEERITISGNIFFKQDNATSNL